jgi:hypothetical protein
MSSTEMNHIVMSTKLFDISSDVDLSLVYKIHSLVRGIYIFTYEYIGKEKKDK